MERVVQLVKRVIPQTRIGGVSGVHLRTFELPADIESWLELRHRAFGRLSVGVRAWTRADFDQEFSSKPWWRPDRMWLAEATGIAGQPQLVGSVTLAKRISDRETKAVVHWLSVLPSWRRKGIATMLMSALESAAVEDGYSEVWLETHAAWTAAAAFYEKLGYERVS